MSYISKLPAFGVSKHRFARTLVLTPLRLALPGGGCSGTQRRFGVFLRALHRMGGAIRLVHIVPEEQIRQAGDPDALSRTQSEFWGVPVEVHAIVRETRQETAWNHYGAGVFGAEAQPAFAPFGGERVAQAVSRHLGWAPDLVFAHRLSSMVPLLRQQRGLPLVVLDNDDIEHKLRVRTALSAPRHPGKPLGLLQVPAVMALERRAVAASSLTFVCSELDRAYLRRLGFGDAVRTVPNAVALPPSAPGLTGDQTLLFLGDANYSPNRLAAERMIHRIWPEIRRRVPSARLLVAGPGSDRLPSASAGLPGVEHLGFVDDLAGLYARSRVACCPIMVGGGTRVKLVEAAAHARPMVSTRIGAEGLDFINGQEILLRDKDAGFGDACVQLLQDDALSARLGQAARSRMASLYDTTAVETRIADMIHEAVQRRPMQQSLPQSDADVFSVPTAAVV